MRKNKSTVKRGNQALEMSMRDVMDNLEEAANYIQYQSEHTTVQILSIEAVRTTPVHAMSADEVRQLTNIYCLSNPPLHRSKDVVSYLLERESKAHSAISA